jgi:N-6 DNA Methylase
MNTGPGETACARLVKAFEQNTVFAHRHSYELYRDWLEAVWAFLDAVNRPREFRQCLDRYSVEEAAEMARIFGVYTDAVAATPFRDILGELFMRLDIHSVRSGQVFTPWDVAVMMARMQFDRTRFEELVRTKGEMTVADPAVGSGALLLAFAKVVHDEMGRSAVNRLRLYGTDIDMRCVLMCRIQLRMNGLDAFGRMAGRLARGERRQGSPDKPATDDATHPGDVWREEEEQYNKEPVLPSGSAE